MKFTIFSLLLTLLVTTVAVNTVAAQSFTIKKKKGLYGVKDKKTKLDIVPYEYDAIEEIGIEKTFFILTKNNKQGIVDAAGNVIFPINCDSILPTVATVLTDFRVFRGDKIGYINDSGYYLPIIYQTIKKEQYKKKLIVQKENKWGVLEEDGKIIYDFEYDDILSYTENYLCAKKDGEWLGIKDNQIIHRGEEVVFEKPDELAYVLVCADVTDNKEREKCTEAHLLKTVVFKNIVYPEKAKIDGIEGMLVMTYEIDTEGNVGKVTVMRDVKGYFEEEGKRLISLYPKFVPATHEGKLVKSIRVQALRFKLD